jgi:uncharacterized tellurite resistance protein B-like protein
LQRFAERVANRTLPHGKSLKSMDSAERVEVYAEQARIAWADGQLERKERMLLDKLRDQLGLSAAEASRLEAQALKGL